MKVKAYVWSGIERPNERFDMGYYNFELIPSVSVDFTTTDMAREDISDWWPHQRDYSGKSIFILVSWLFWGVTLDFRFGDDMRESGE